MAILLAGALTGVLAVFAVAGLFIFKNAGTGAPTGAKPSTSELAASAPGEKGTASSSFKALDGAPDACSVMTDKPKELVPGAEPTPAEATDTNNSTRCTWGDIGAGDDPRELSVELRSVDGADAIYRATAQFGDEAQTDKTGDNLLPSQKQKYYETLNGLGDQAYVFFYSESNNAQGVVAARVGNVLITVTYGGSQDDDTPLSQKTCVDGAKSAAEDAVEAIRKLGAA